MSRKPLALAIVLLIAGLAPASAIIGLCARMPCCNHAPAASAALANDGTECCTTVTCYDAPSAKLTTNVQATTPFVGMRIVAFTASVMPVIPIVSRAFIDTSPPRSTCDRLAVLSILLI